MICGCRLPQEGLKEWRSKKALDHAWQGRGTLPIIIHIYVELKNYKVSELEGLLPRLLMEEVRVGGLCFAGSFIELQVCKAHTFAAVLYALATVRRKLRSCAVACQRGA